MKTPRCSALLSKTWSKMTERFGGQRITRHPVCVEQLESRVLLATFVVNVISDVIIPPQGGGNCFGGACTLRMAVLAANATAGADTIDFSLFPTATLALGLGEMSITESVTINGPAGALAASTIISGGSGASQSRIFSIGGPGVNVFNINNVTLADGNGVGQFEGFGGAVLAFDGFQNNDTINMNNVVVQDSTGSQQGGGIKATAVTLNLTNSAIVDNTSTGPFGGGGLGIQDAQVTLTNVTVSGNDADVSGGGLGNLAFGSGASSSTTLINTTIANNTSPIGAGVHNVVSGGSSANLVYRNSIFANNDGSDNFGNSGTGASISSGGSNISDDGSGGLNQLGDKPNTDPLIAPLATHAVLGVSTSATIPSHPLQPGSPAIDSAFASGPNLDQRGVPNFDGNFNNAITRDIGAYEFTPIRVSSANDTVANDGVCTLREAVSSANSDVVSGDQSGECGANGDSIIFHPNLGDPLNPVRVVNGELAVTQPLTVSGLDADQLHISAVQNNRIFNFNATDFRTFTVEKLTLRDGNAGSDPGGAIIIVGDSLNVKDVVIRDSHGSAGGAIEFSSGSLNIENSTLMNNTASSGGAVRMINTRAELKNVTVSGNSATSDSGGIVNVANGQFATSVVTLINSTVANNSAPTGANVRVFTQNQAIFAHVLALNSIFAEPNGSGNFAFSGPGAQFLSTGPGTNIVDDFSFPLGGSQLGIDPILGPLGDNGGTTPTHALLAGSPAIDQGSDLAPSVLSTDQRGVARPQGTQFDVGAFEAEGVPDVDVTDLGTATDLENIKLTYTIAGLPWKQLTVGFFTSDDARLDGLDTEVGSRVTITDPNLLSVGSHTLDIAQPALDQFLADSGVSFLLANLDIAGEVSESDETNNDQHFAGVHHRVGTGLPLVVRGNDAGGRNTTTGNDNVRFARVGPNLQVTFNGSVSTAQTTTVPSVLALGNQGRDDIRSKAGVLIPMNLIGSEGNDVLVGGDRNDTIVGGGGGDQINGRKGNDLLDGPGSSGEDDRRDIIFGFDGLDTLIGGKGNDKLVGMAGDDSIMGGADHDALVGRDGNDTMLGGDGHDILLGGRNDDSMNGDGGADRLFGVGGNDNMEGGSGSDTLRGGANNDFLNGSEDNLIDDIIDMIFGESGFDTLLGTLDPLDFIKRNQLEDDQRSL